MKTQTQTACVAIEALPLYETEAKERKIEAAKKYHKGSPKDKALMPEPLPQARDFAAEDFHVAARYISDAKKLKENHPQVFEEIKKGKTKD